MEMVKERIDSSNTSGRNNWKCTVLLSSYNGEKYIEEQINSILRQKDIACNIVIRDDGSTDSTVKKIRSIQAGNPGRIELLEGDNAGIHKSFYILMHYTLECEYVAFSDQDDIWDEDKLVTAINEMKAKQFTFYSCASRIVDENGISIGKSTANEKLYNYYIKGNSKILTPGAQGCTMVMTNRFFRYVLDKGIPEQYGHDTWIPIIAYYLNRGVYDPNPHMSYRQHNNSWTGNRKKKVKQLFVEIRYFIKGLSRYKQLSKDIISRFTNDFSKDDIVILHCLADENTKMLDRYKAIKMYKFGKYGMLENFVFKLYYIFLY